MNLFGVIILYILAGLAKTARHLNRGPQWLREFELGKTTLY